MANEKQALKIFPNIRKRLWLWHIDIHIAALSRGATLNTDDEMWSEVLLRRVAQIQIFPHILCSDFFEKKK